MQYHLLTKLVLEKGVDTVQIPESLKKTVFTEAAQALCKKGDFVEAGKAFAKANNMQQLEVVVQWLKEQGRAQDIAALIIHTNKQKEMEDCAMLCMKQGHFREAEQLFKKIGREDMLHFLKQNFS